MKEKFQTPGVKRQSTRASSDASCFGVIWAFGRWRLAFFVEGRNA